jgi:hypothetical protein
MPCFRFDLHRRFPLYLDDAASPQSVQRIERHLLDCGACRARLVRMRAAKTLLGELPALDAPPFEQLMARMPARTPARAERRAFTAPRFLRHLAADAVIASVLFLVFTLFYTHAAVASRPFDPSSFRAIGIREIATNDDPHVVVSGVVSEMEGNFQEGSRRFRLSDPNHSNAFVVCEILDGDPLRAPKPGMRARVWGVSRYDANPDHEWFEIHPVLKVEVVR